MSCEYRSLRDDSDVSNEKNSKSCVTLAIALACLIVLGIVLAIVVLERPPPMQDQETLPQESGGTADECRMVLVESIPEQMRYKGNVTFGLPLEKAWKTLISMATEQVDLVSFYWTLTGEDIGVNSSSDQPGRDILEGLGELPSRNISVRALASIPSVKANSTDLKILKQKGVHVRRVNFGRLTGGVLHSKFWIVDRKHIFIGSANIDWRALTQVKELGVVIYNCSSLAKDLHKIFQSYWVMGQANSSLPQRWPAEYDAAFDKHRPLLVKAGNVSSRLYLTGSPPSFCPVSRTMDLEAIISIISEARHFVHIAVMDYSPTMPFEKPRRYWSLIDDTIRAAAYERKVKIRMLISCGRASNPVMLPFLQSLAAMDNHEHGISVQIKLYIVPVGNQTDIPYSRVNHNKYMVTDKVAYIGTSNWSGEYFMNTAGVGLVIAQRSPPNVSETEVLQSQLGSVFDRDWNSEFAVALADLGHRQDCALAA
ncbi:5'-3' exonuclease PLD4 [Takifugu flavidus]|uniref:Phospholipase D4 n=1 Tax=Takifugu flavidus TaxID=433684 RepID=A0A5C6P2C6_9TELE|nr:5'-3' exonuclease PLD4 [Takifugu flavidus]XP_056867799.1 5'-3' exonuclease PLD4 [Takifugu flavidus]XP_056867800.1 5'-3' exonuclease PLD4 [Takifugu flavidus]TWW72237.1 Phospholipase D4 [Takifugu flavidus]